MDFSLTTLFVATSGTLASSGSTDALTAGQIGLFGPAYSIVNAGNIANSKYIYIAQGRKENTPGVGSKRSDKIDKNKIIEWYKTVAESDVTNEIVEISDFSVKCGEDITVTLRAHSSYIDTLFYNGLTKSVTVKTDCCECGELPCTDLDPEATVDKLVAKFNGGGNDFLGAQDNVPITKFFEFSRTGSGETSKLRIVAKPLDKYGNPCDLAAFPWEYDRLWFRAFVYAGPATSQDFIVADPCDQVGTVTVVQRATYAKGSSDEIKQLEKNYYSYQTPAFKHLHEGVGWNGAYESLVVDGTFYDLYYLKFVPHDQSEETRWQDAVVMDSTVIVAFPTGTGSSFEEALTAYIGAPVDKSGLNITTTTSTSTTSTTTTTTTTLIP